MKTTRKGFTLIELIVVIAIIGVLAMILVPSMLGYVRKSKVSTANSAAASVQKALNTSLIEFDEEGVDISNVSKIAKPAGGALTADGGLKVADLEAKLMQYMDDYKRSAFAFESRITGGVCDAVAATADGIYPGTYPSGVVTADNVQKTYQSGNKANIAKALTDAAAKADKNKGKTATTT